jgi:hypothetical protein
MHELDSCLSGRVLNSHQSGPNKTFNGVLQKMYDTNIGEDGIIFTSN